jgi:ABC-type sugar transport system ATPase subunit
MRQVTKPLGATRALQEADFEVRIGEGHALIRENAAGKGTLVKMPGGSYF